jgi:hypothetical protein
MNNYLCEIPVKVIWKGEELELMSLEQLYVRCVNTNTRLPGTREGLDGFLAKLRVVLRKECYDHLAKLMKNSTRVDFANSCIRKGLSPFGARMEAFNEAQIGRGKIICHWPDCPTP